MHKFYKPFTTLKSKKEQLKIENELGGDNPVSYRSSRESMSKSVLGLRRRNIMLALAAFLLVIFSTTVYAACVTPTRGMVITKDTTFCSGTYNFDGIDSGVIVIGSSSITLDCSNAIFIGNNYGTGLRTSTSPAVNNVIIKNCEFRNYNLPIYILGQTTLNAHHITMENIKVRGGRDIANILVVGCDDCIFRNIDSSDAKNLVSDPLPPHGLYISGGPDEQTGDNILIENSKFNNNAASGIRISDIDGRHHDNIIVRNTIISNNVDAGLVINACQDCKFTGNTIYNNGNRGISIGTSSITESRDITISGNTIYDNSFDDFILWGSNGVNIRNNNYPRNKLSVSLRSESIKNYNIEENTPHFEIVYHSANSYASDAKVIMSYSGTKKVGFTNNELIFTFTKPYNDIKNAVTGIIINANTNSHIYKISKNQQIEIGNFVDDPVIVNQPPQAPVVTMTSNDWTTNSDITCAAYIDDPDSNSINTNIQWFKNGVINKSISIDNKQPKTTVTNTLSKTTIKTGDQIYCRARSYDGEKFGEWTYANTKTVESLPSNAIPVINSITAYSYDSTINNDVLCLLNIDDSNDDPMTVTLHWYKNGAFFKSVTKYNQHPGEITEPLTKDNLAVGDSWQCRSRLYDGKNYSSWKQSNTISIQQIPVPNEEEPEEKPRKSGGGGGSSYSPPVVVVEEPVVEAPIIEEPVVEEPTFEELNVYNDEQVEITAQSANVEEPVNIETDLITGDVVLETDNPGNGLWLFFGVMISGILLFINRKQLVVATSKAAPVVEKQFLAVKAKFLVKPNQQIIYYMLKKLNDGYSYEAIAEVLKKKGYKDRIIDHHVKILQSEGHQPHIRYPGPQKYHIPASKKAKLISDIQEYTRIHIHEGFRLDDIKAVLLYSGHPYDLIEEAIHG